MVWSQTCPKVTVGWFSSPTPTSSGSVSFAPLTGVPFESRTRIDQSNVLCAWVVRETGVLFMRTRFSSLPTLTLSELVTREPTSN